MKKYFSFFFVSFLFLSPLSFSKELLKAPRSGFIKTNPSRDAKKILVDLDNGGWIISSNLLIGQVDKKIGAFSLKQPTPQPVWWFHGTSRLSAPAKALGQSLFLAFENGSLVHLDLLTGNTIWTLQLDAMITRKIITLPDQSLVVVSARQTVYNIDPKSGVIQWGFSEEKPKKLQTRNLADPLFYKNQLLVTFDSGQIISLKPESGKVSVLCTAMVLLAQGRKKCSLRPSMAIQMPVTIPLHSGSTRRC